MIEMVIVVSIFSVLVFILTPSFGGVFRLGAKAAANEIGASLDGTKREAMSRLSGKLHLYRKDGAGDWYVDFYIHNGSMEVLSDSRKVADKNVEVAYNLADGSGTEIAKGQMPGGEGLLITYDRRDGSFMPLQKPGTAGNREEVTATKAYFEPLLFDGQPVYVSRITCTRGSGSVSLILSPKAGTYSLAVGK